MSDIKTAKLSPLNSGIRFIGKALSNQVHFPNQFNGKQIRIGKEEAFEIFRHIVIGSVKDLYDEQGALFIVKFKLENMSLEKNIKFSRFPIPMFTGLPGFRAKFWMLSHNTGYNQGIYQWKSVADAKNYSQSFAMNFMKKRSIPNSASFMIIPDSNIYDFINPLII